MFEILIGLAIYLLGVIFVFIIGFIFNRLHAYDLKCNLEDTAVTCWLSWLFVVIMLVAALIIISQHKLSFIKDTMLYHKYKDWYNNTKEETK